MDTFEIVIPDTYGVACPFIGDYALVWDQENDESYIINKHNEIVLSNIEDAFLFDSEDGEMIFALTANFSGADYSYGHWRPSQTNYRLYNLSIGKEVLENDAREYIIYNNYIPKIMAFSNYISYDDDLYIINPDGTLTKSTMSVEDAVSQIVKERGMQYNENVFRYWSGFIKKYFEYSFYSFFGYSDNLDLELLINRLPANMSISGDGGHVGENEKPTLRIFPINWDGIHPFRNKDLLYSVQLFSNQDKPYSGTIFGLYNSSEDKWIISPIIGVDSFSDSFFASGYDDLVILDNGENGKNYYNIKTMKEYKGLYVGQTPSWRFDGYMLQNVSYFVTYYGYSQYFEIVIIYDFE